MSTLPSLKLVQDWLATLVSPSRYSHSLRVAQTAQDLARHWNVDPEIAYYAGILHDCAKASTPTALANLGIVCPDEITRLHTEYPPVWHAFSGPFLAQHQWGPLPDFVAGAMTLHTTGGANMTVLEQIIYVADYIEPGRSFAAVPFIANLAYADLNEALFSLSSLSIALILKRGLRIHPYTFACRDYALATILAPRAHSLCDSLWAFL